MQPDPHVLVLCTVSTGLEALRALQYACPSARMTLVGLDPRAADPEAISGYIDVMQVADALGVQGLYVHSYALRDREDRARLEAIGHDLIWVAGWQRLIPAWLIDSAPLGALGTHGSVDGITGGRGRSPQNWALLLGAGHFELALFRIAPGVDDGAVVAHRRITYAPEDDIEVSHYRVALAAAEMMAEVLDDPARLDQARAQTGTPGYFPQRSPEDGVMDWTLSGVEAIRQIRALTRPYPGARSSSLGATVFLWRAQVFDSVSGEDPGTIGPCFGSGDFLVSCGEGRILVRDWTADMPDWRPEPGLRLQSRGRDETMRDILSRHQARHPDQPLNARLRALHGQEQIFT